MECVTLQWNSTVVYFTVYEGLYTRGDPWATLQYRLLVHICANSAQCEMVRCVSWGMYRRHMPMLARANIAQCGVLY